VPDRQEKKPQGSFIELSSGDYLDLLAPDPSLITPEVLAHHLSQANRYAGAPIRPISVCEHTILVSKKLEADGEDPWVCLMGLHHDDPEAFLHDITRPLKDQLPPYRVLEKKFEVMIRDDVFQWRPMVKGEAESVKQADYWALACEAHYLMPSGGRGWWCEGLYDNGSVNQRSVAQFLLYPDQSLSNLIALWIYRHNRLVTASKQMASA
jgi:hypothetical protein